MAFSFHLSNLSNNIIVNHENFFEKIETLSRNIEQDKENHLVNHLFFLSYSFKWTNNYLMKMFARRMLFNSVGGYLTGSQPPQIIREAILRLCIELKDQSVSLADAVAPTDFVLNSPIGKSDGEVSFHFLL